MTDNPLRRQFPIFAADSEHQHWVYFDSASTTQKPQQVVDRISHYLIRENANVHRASYQLASHTTTAFEHVREQVCRLINANSPREIIWTQGTTAAVNMLSRLLPKVMAKPRRKILLSPLEHHSNLVPWQQLQPDYQLAFLPIDQRGCIQMEAALAMIDQQTAILALSQASNALGNITPLQPLLAKAKQCGVLSVVDGAQAIAHMPVDVQALDCDFYLFSGHKLYGPTGIGVLYGKAVLLEALPVDHTGGEMVSKVAPHQASYQPIPYKYEAGTPNILGVLGLGAAIDFYQTHRVDIEQQESRLYRYLLRQLQDIPEVQLLGNHDNTVPILSFTLDNWANKDVAVYLDQKGIALRTGHHCAMPLMQALDVSGSIRVSLACYNTFAEIDYLVTSLRTLLEQVPAHSACNNDQASPPNLEPLGVIARAIRSTANWDQRYRYILWAAKRLNVLATSQRTPQRQILGCESDVWLHCQVQNQQLQLQAYSPSHIVSGLLAILFEAVESLSLEQVALFDPNAYFQDIGLQRYVSDSRIDGMLAATNTIKQQVKNHSAERVSPLLASVQGIE